MRNIKYDGNVGKYLSETKLKSLHDSINYLDDYIIDDNIVGFITVGDENKEIHFPKTQALILLSALNKEREKLIEFLMSKDMILEIKRKHFLNSYGYISNTNCPLALAVKEYFKTENISVGGLTFTNYDTNTTYSFNEDLWNESIVEPKIKEAEKCFKNKKKFNSVFLEIEKK